MSSLMLLLVWLRFFLVLMNLLPILGTLSGKTANLMVLALISLGNNRQDCFFFQAEDGIRDDLVTGVQTCALPIWSRPGCRRRCASSTRRAPPRSRRRRVARPLDAPSYPRYTGCRRARLTQARRTLRL